MPLEENDLSAQMCTAVDPENIFLSYPLGGGSSFTVHRGKWRGIDVVVKVLKSEANPEFFRQEVAVRQMLVHDRDRIVHVFGSCNLEGQPCFVMEYLHTGSLHKLLFNDTWVALPFMLQLRLICDIATALAYLHSRDVVHGNLTPRNILVGQDYKAKVGGLSCACISPEVWHPKRCAHPPYLAPEVMNGQSYTAAADVYSFGVIAWEIATRKKAHDHNIAQVLLAAVTGRTLALPKEHAHREFRDVLEACMQVDAEKRASIHEVCEALEHCFKNEGLEDEDDSPFAAMSMTRYYSCPPHIECTPHVGIVRKVLASKHTM